MIDDHLFDKNIVEQVSSINVKQYLLKKNRLLALCVFQGIDIGNDTFLETVMAAETENDPDKSKVLEMVISNFPKLFRQIALSFNEDSYKVCDKLDKLETCDNTWVDIENITVKILQNMLKVILNKTSTLDVNTKVGINNFNDDNFVIFRTHCKNTKLRSIFYRMVNNDFFSRERMFRFKMIDDLTCTRCVEIETTKHMLWECFESKKIWEFLNNILEEKNLCEEKISDYSDLFNVKNSEAVSIIKMKLIQAMIQIDKPKGWNKTKVVEVISDISRIEKYNAVKNKTLNKWKNIWTKISS